MAKRKTASTTKPKTPKEMIPTKILSVCIKSLEVKMRNPRPLSAAIISAETMVIKEFPIASLIPVRRKGIVEGRITLIKMLKRLAPNDRADCTWIELTLITPAIVLIVTMKIVV